MGKVPVLHDVVQVSDGWIKKYVLTYGMPDGSLYEYESVSRKGMDAYRRELERNAVGLPPVPDAVCIVPRLPDGSLLLLREFRYPLNSWCIAFPAGLVEPDESLVAAVDRELREETGYRLRVQGEAVGQGEAAAEGKAASAREEAVAGVGENGTACASDADARAASVEVLPQSGYSSTGLAEENVQVVFAQVEQAGEAQPEPSEFIELFTLAQADIARFLAENTTPIGTRCQLILEMFARTLV